MFLQVVYLSETAGYIPVTSLRNRPTGINAGYHIDGDIEGWRHESWDRDSYTQRNRINNTRVQRKPYFHMNSKSINLFAVVVLISISNTIYSYLDYHKSEPYACR